MTIKVKNLVELKPEDIQEIVDTQQFIEVEWFRGIPYRVEYI